MYIITKNSNAPFVINELETFNVPYEVNETMGFEAGELIVFTIPLAALIVKTTGAYLIERLKQNSPSNIKMKLNGFEIQGLPPEKIIKLVSDLKGIESAEEKMKILKEYQEIEK
jgi:hypothetical protein